MTVSHFLLGKYGEELPFLYNYRPQSTGAKEKEIEYGTHKKALEGHGPDR